MPAKQGSDPEAVVKEIRRQTRRKFTAEEKIRIVLEGLKGEASIAELCGLEGITENSFGCTQALAGFGTVYRAPMIPDGRKAI